MRSNAVTSLLLGLVILGPVAGAAPPAKTSAAPPVTAALLLPEGLAVTDLKSGQGSDVVAGAWVRVRYTGWLYDAKAAQGKGREFDSTQAHGEPLVFQIGRQRVIRGWDLGIVGMRAGGKRRLVIAEELAYGARGAGDGVIPPHSTLVFEVEVVDFLPPL
jgi:FKBP-type peptidyl-prolyl cis-trans isomerase